EQAGGGGLAPVVNQNQLGTPRLGGGERPQRLEMRRQTLGAVPYGHDHGQVDCAITHAHKDTASSTQHTQHGSFSARERGGPVSDASGTIKHVSDTARWVALYFPDVIAYKQQQLAGERPACALEQIGADLTDAAHRRALFAQLGAAAPRVLVVSEGLLIYLTGEQVGALARDLSAQPSF